MCIRDRTITDPISLEQTNTANGFSDGLITLNSVIDSYDDLIAIDAIETAQVTMANAVVQVTDEVDLSKINELRADTTGDITVDEVKETKENLTAINEFVAEQGVAGDVILSNSDITVTDVVNKSEADTINAYSDQGGTVFLTSISDIFENVTDLQNNQAIDINNSEITISDVISLYDCLLYTSDAADE